MSWTQRVTKADIAEANAWVEAHPTVAMQVAATFEARSKERFHARWNYLKAKYKEPAMSFLMNDYQQAAHESALYPREQGTYPFLGLAGECGEVMELCKKTIRDHKGVWSPERKAMLEKELGDVLWYLAEIATQQGLSLDTIATGNIRKLQQRLAAKTIHGEGSDR